MPEAEVKEEVKKEEKTLTLIHPDRMLMLKYLKKRLLKKLKLRKSPRTKNHEPRTKKHEPRNKKLKKRKRKK